MQKCIKLNKTYCFSFVYLPFLELVSLIPYPCDFLESSIQILQNMKLIHDTPPLICVTFYKSVPALSEAQNRA